MEHNQMDGEQDHKTECEKGRQRDRNVYKLYYSKWQQTLHELGYKASYILIGLC